MLDDRPPYDPPYDPDDDPDDEGARSARLAGLGTFAHLIGRVGWFHRVGGPLTEEEVALAQQCADAMGFPDYPVAALDDWTEVGAVAANLDWNGAWWEAEEQARMALTDAALDVLDPDALDIALTHIRAEAAKIIPDSAWQVATMRGIGDEALIEAAVGHATRACHHAALLIATGATADDAEAHPFVQFYRLFERGRWPLGVVGGTFQIF